MVCSPEVSRRNGAKSMGPVSERGKAIASQNSSKHGLLATQPPLLVTEDLSTFEGLVQGLIDHYQPKSPVEHFLIQQVAMGMLKQHRLWSVESAIANIEILKAQKSVQFPDHITPPEVDLGSGLASYAEKHTPMKDVLKKEARILDGLVRDLTYDLGQSQKIGGSKTLALFRDSLEQNYFYEDRSAEVWRYQNSFDEWMASVWNEKRKCYVADLQDAIAHANRLIELAQNRISEVEQRLKELEGLERGIQQAQAMSQGIQKPELFLRYQQNINRNLYEALDRLEDLRQRKNESSIGSFGTNG